MVILGTFLGGIIFDYVDDFSNFRMLPREIVILTIYYHFTIYDHFDHFGRGQEKWSFLTIFDYFEGKTCEKFVFVPINPQISLEHVHRKSLDDFEQLYNIFRGFELDFHVKIVIFGLYRPILDKDPP